MWLSNILLIQALKISTVTMLCLDIAFLTTKDKYLKQNLLGMTSSVSLMDCAAVCQSYQQCQSFGFEPRTKSCHLHGKSSDSVPSDLIFKNDWIHGNMMDWPKTLLGPCAEHNCPEGQKCHVNRLTKDQICVTGTLSLPQDLCPVPPEVTNAVLSPGGQEIGASRTYTCQDEYLDTESFLTSAETTCLPDNTWAPVNLTCSGRYIKQEFKPEPTYTFQNIESDVLARLTGSTSSLIYLVKTCKDSNFLLHENLDYSTGETYEVAVGGWSNTQSAIRKGIQGPRKYVTREAGLVSCTEFRPFWLSWANDIITVGKGNILGQNELLRWSPDPPMQFNFVSYSSYINNPGLWYFLVQ